MLIEELALYVCVFNSIPTQGFNHEQSRVMQWRREISRNGYQEEEEEAEAGADVGLLVAQL